MNDSTSGLTVTSDRTVAISRQEAERIRMRLGDAEVVDRWLERARRINAPDATPDGPLAKSETGWLVARGGLGAHLWPSLTSWAVGASAATVLVLAVLRPVLKIALRYAPVLALAVLGTGLAAAFGLSQLFIKWKLARWRRTAVAFAQANAPIPQGTLVRLTGRILPQSTISTLFLGRPTVLARNRVGGADETRGHDFAVELDDGRRVTVEVRGARLLDPLTRVDRPACGPVHALGTKLGPRIHSDFLSPAPFYARWARCYESSVGPGDVVEVIGSLEHGPGPAPALYGTDETPLLVSRIDRGA